MGFVKNPFYRVFYCANVFYVLDLVLEVNLYVITRFFRFTNLNLITIEMQLYKYGVLATLFNRPSALSTSLRH